MLSAMPEKSKRQTGRKRRIAAYVVIFVLLLLAALLYTVSAYKRKHFGDAQVDEILFYMSNGLADGHTANFIDGIRDNILLFLILFFLLLLPVVDFYRDRIVIYFKLGRRKNWAFNPSRMPMWPKLIYAVFIFLVSLWWLLSSFYFMDYLKSLSQSSQLFEDHYIDPKGVKLEFPARKRNLVYIYMESMENTLGSREHGGQMKPSRIPELEALALDPANIQFSNKPSGLGGSVPATGTTWTVAAMSAQSSGVPLKNSLFGLGQNDQGALRYFLPGSYGVGDVLEDAGYNQTFIMGSKATFGGRDKLLGQHGDYRILDHDSLVKLGKLAPDYSVWWGFEDRKLFEFAREEAVRLASEDKPFNLQLLTADTHFSDGYLDPTCPTPYQRQYDNVWACSSARVAEFVAWLQRQPFAKDTTIILTGDHLGMQTEYYDAIVAAPGYQRTVYNVFINSALTTERSRSRLFSSFDMYPTTLAALGVRIPGEQLGLGVNLFSDERTLIEQYGSLEAFNAELGKRSAYYDRRIIAGESE